MRNPIYKKSKYATRADQMFAQFQQFHAENPRVWSIFKAAADRHFERGRKHYSAYLIIEEIRWHESMDGLRINNNHIPYYSRMYRAVNKGNPKQDFFERRRRKSADRPPFLEVVDRLPVEKPDEIVEAQTEMELITIV
jgi:hypothetical protein